MDELEMERVMKWAEGLAALIEAEADKYIDPILAELKTTTGVEPGPLGKHWIELGRFNGVHAALMYLNARGWLTIPEKDMQ